MTERRAGTVGLSGAFTLGALCGGMVVLAGVLTWMEKLPERDTPARPRAAQVSKTPQATGASPAGDPSSIDAFREQLAEAQDRIRELEAEHEQQADRAMTDAILDVLANTIDRSAADRARKRADSVLQGSQRRIDLKKNVMFGGLYDTISMLIALGRLGDTGVDKLIETALDESRPREQREAAFEALTFFPDARALEIILHPPEPMEDLVDGGLEFKEILARSASWVATDDLKPLMNDLYESGTPGAAHGDENALQLMGVLAFVHGYEPAQKLFEDRSLQRGYGRNLLIAAQWAGGDAARAYVEDLSRRHPERDVRDQAAAMLANW